MSASSERDLPVIFAYELFNFSGVNGPTVEVTRLFQMTDSASSFMAILLGLGVFAVILAIGWRSVQNRRILRLRGENGQETIIVAGEDDDVSSVVTTSETNGPAPRE